MIQIKILGTGCSKCRKLYAVTEKAITAAGVEAELTKVEDIDAIMAYGVMMTPALVVDEQVLSSGRLPRLPQITTWLSAAAAKRI